MERNKLIIIALLVVIAALLVGIFMSMPNLEKQIEEGHHYYLAYHEGQPCGYVSVQYEGTDTGAIILQKAVAVEKGDTPEILQRRVMEQAEWKILPQAIDLIANDKLEMIDGKVWISSEEALVEGRFVQVCIDGIIDGELTGYILEE